MKKKIITLITALFFLGCEDSDSKPTTIIPQIITTEQMLENKEYASLITSLERTATTNDDYLSLATAYMGLSGFTVDDIIETIYDSDSSADKSFQELILNINNTTKEHQIPLENLNKATYYYSKIVLESCSEENINKLTDTQKDLCLYKGLSQTMETVTAINYLSVENKIEASSCAIQYSFNGNSDCTFLEKSPLTFTQTDKEYERVTILHNGKEFQYLLHKNILNFKDIIMTNGYCTLDDFSTRVQDKEDSNYDANSYYVCPVEIGNSVSYLTVEEVLVNSFNEGIETILLAAKDNQKLTDISLKFKQEILNSTDTNKEININHIITYFKEYNQ